MDSMINPIMLWVCLCCGSLVALISFLHWFRFDFIILEEFVGIQCNHWTRTNNQPDIL
jgi:hypothetical protein